MKPYLVNPAALAKERGNVDIPVSKKHKAEIEEYFNRLRP